jgi:predicted nucleotidyltransferase
MGDLKTIVSELRKNLAAIYGPDLCNVLLFGSQARGDAEPGSDIDVLVVLPGPVNPGAEVRRTGGLVAELSLKHDVVISCVFVSSENLAAEQSPFMMNVRKEALVI